MLMKLCYEEPEIKGNLLDLDADGSIILKWISNTIRVVTEFVCSGQRSVGSSCEYSYIIRGLQFLDGLNRY
jgi:hypothetical protein